MLKTLQTAQEDIDQALKPLILMGDQKESKPRPSF
jgi:hypothetical protein